MAHGSLLDDRADSITRFMEYGYGHAQKYRVVLVRCALTVYKGGMKAFGDLVRHARLDRDLSLREAARLLEISPTYLSQIENGKVRPPSTDVLRKLSALYSTPKKELSLDTLLQHARARLPESVGQDAAEDRVTAALLRKVLDLDVEVRVGALKELLKTHGHFTEADIDALIRKMTTDFPRLRSGREEMFAADVEPRRLTARWIEARAEQFLPNQYHPPTKVDVIIERQPDIRILVDDDLDPDPDSKPRILGVTHWHEDEVHRVIKMNAKLIEDGSDTSYRRYRYTLGHEFFHAIEHLPLMGQRHRNRGACLREAVLEDAGVVHNVASEPPSSVEQVPEAPTWWLRQRSGPRPLQTNEDWREWQCNVFARALLMPTASVQAEFAARFGEDAIVAAGDTRETAWNLATAEFSDFGCFAPLYQLYDVSRQAMAIRLLSLGLVVS